MRGLLAVVSALLIAAGCGGRERRAKALIESGQLAEAERLLVEEVREHPTNLEAHFLLGRERILRNRPDDAARAFAVVEPAADYAARVADVYWRAAPEDPDLKVRYLRRAVSLDPELGEPACVQALALARRLFQRGEEVGAMVLTSGKFDLRCRRKTLRFVESMIRDSDRGVDPRIANRLAVAAKRLAPESTRVMAAAMRDRARAVAPSDPYASMALLRNAIVHDSAIDSDPETAALRSAFVHPPAGPAPSFEKVDPLELTLAAVDEVGWAVVSYVRWNRQMPPAADIDALAKVLVPRYLEAMPRDGWGSALHYVANGWNMRVISVGSDGMLTPQSADLSVEPRGMLDGGGGDIIWEDGAIVQRPIAARSATLGPPPAR
jgi:hypothetical protein